MNQVFPLLLVRGDRIVYEYGIGTRRAYFPFSSALRFDKGRLAS